MFCEWELFLIAVLIAFIATFIHFVYLPEIMEWFQPDIAHAMTNKEVCEALKYQEVEITNVPPEKVIEYCNGLARK